MKQKRSILMLLFFPFVNLQSAVKVFAFQTVQKPDLTIRVLWRKHRILLWQAALMSASPGRRGGKRGLDYLEQVLSGLGGEVVKTKTVVPQTHQAFDSNQNLQNESVKKQLKQEVAKLHR